MMNRRNGAEYQPQRDQHIPDPVCTRTGQMCGKGELWKVIQRQCFLPLDFLCTLVYHVKEKLKKKILRPEFHVSCPMLCDYV